MAAPILVSLTDFKRLLPADADPAADADLTLFLLATDELVASIAGPLTGPIPARWRVAARIIAVHLWDHWQGAVPVPYNGGSDETLLLTGFAIPRAARELLVVPKPLGSRGPAFSFPEPSYCWPVQ